MMDFLINDKELSGLCGLPHIQQLTYLRGIRPYMDVLTGIVGVKRGISYQSISEQLYVEPHSGIKSVSYSRAQLRRALSGLERAGLIEIQSEGLRLILKCPAATLGYSVQNKAVTNPSQQAVLFETQKTLENKGEKAPESNKADTAKSAKADIPLKEDNYIYLFSHFEKFWNLYPLKKSKQKTWEAYQALSPSQELQGQIINALQQQIQFYQKQKTQGQWVAAWKFPANWLAQQCWEDEVQDLSIQEQAHAIDERNHQKKPVRDSFWESCKSGIEAESSPDNIIQIDAYRRASQAY